MKITVVARPLPSRQWLVKVAEVPSVAAVFGTLKDAGEVLREEIASVKGVDLAEVETQLHVALDARAEWVDGTWVATVPLVGGLDERTTWLDEVPALISDMATMALGDENLLVDVHVDVAGPFWVTRSEEGQRYIAGVHGMPSLLHSGDSEQEAVQGVIDKLLAAEPDSPWARHLRGTAVADDADGRRAQPHDTPASAARNRPESGYTTAQVKTHLREFQAHLARQKSLRIKKSLIDGVVDHHDRPDSLHASTADPDVPVDNLSADAIYDAITGGDERTMRLIAAAVKADVHGVVALNLETALARGVDARTAAYFQDALETASSGNQSLWHAIKDLPDTRAVEEIDLRDHDRCDRVHINDLRTGPAGVSLYLEGGRIGIGVEGGNFYAEADTLEEAAAQLVAELREYAKTWKPNAGDYDIKGDRAARVAFLRSASDAEISTWVIPEGLTTGALVNAPVDPNPSAFARDDWRAHLEPAPPGEVIANEYLHPRGLTVDDLADRSGIPLERIQSIIKGTVPLEHPDTVLIAAVIGASPSFLRTIARRYRQANDQ
ncbi:helix-turn-helix transcriptional regulator [Demequina maris]|uniref:helix-turn-helix transcriptional regulator n=1 Tax=Demequina maris TaxID=1638982 RepID=UPI000781CC97|nr:hypothetical protein [Demequina maris]